MTAYGLINLLTTACAADAPFKRGHQLWWVPDRYKAGGYLELAPARPTRDAINLSENENGVMRVGLEV